MFEAKNEILNQGRVHKFSLTQAGQPLSYRTVLQLWQDHKAFRTFFITLLRDAPFAAYRWETPPVSVTLIDRDFEFVLLDSPGLARRPDPSSFARHFAQANEPDTVLSFPNLGRDAYMIVPCPNGPDGAYVHLATFIRQAPEGQRHELWQKVGQTMEQYLTAQPVWLSTAGGGVAWLHVRLDSRPKYYGYGPYRTSLKLNVE